MTMTIAGIGHSGDYVGRGNKKKEKNPIPQYGYRYNRFPPLCGFPLKSL